MPLVLPVLSTLFACAPREGTYVLTVTGVETDCERPVADAGSWSGVYRADLEAKGVRFFGEGWCTPYGGALDCELADADAHVDLSDEGVDAAWSVDWGLAGEWSGETDAAGELALAVGCEGEDCATFAGVAPEACTATWSWAAAWRGEDEELAACPADLPEVDAVAALGDAAEDPVRVDSDAGEGWVLSPLVLGPSGAVASTPQVHPDAFTADAHLYLPEGGWEPGAHQLLGAWAEPERWAPVDPVGGCPAPAGPRHGGEASRFTVGDFGHDPRVSPELLADTRWVVRASNLYASGADIAGLNLWDTLGLDILAVQGDTAQVRLTFELGAETCVVLQDTATFDAEGRLSWARARIEAATDPEPLILVEPAFSVGFDADGLRAAGGWAEALVDVRATAGTDYDLCTLVAGFGGACAPCPDDGAPSCLDAALVAWSAERAGVPTTEELPWCGVDFSEDGGYDFSLQVDCGSGGGCAAAGAAVVGPLALLRRRKARGAGDAPRPS